jgi:transcriptional regulator with XRE-family HTH domain
MEPWSKESDAMSANNRWASKDRSRDPEKTYRPTADRSGMIGSEMTTRLADLRLSLNEMARMTGISGATMTRYSQFDEPGRLPLWIETVLRYARLDPWFGRRLRGPEGYVRLRGSDQDRYEEILVKLEAVAAALVDEDEGLAFNRTIALVWSCRKMAAHLRRVRNKKHPRSPVGEEGAP